MLHTPRHCRRSGRQRAKRRCHPQRTRDRQCHAASRSQGCSCAAGRIARSHWQILVDSSEVVLATAWACWTRGGGCACESGELSPNVAALHHTTLSCNDMGVVSVAQASYSPRDNMNKNRTMIRKGSHVASARPAVTCLPDTNIHAASVTMFHDSLPLYRMWFSARATCEWQLSQLRCSRTQGTDKDERGEHMSLARPAPPTT